MQIGVLRYFTSFEPLDQHKQSTNSNFFAQLAEILTTERNSTTNKQDDKLKSISSKKAIDSNKSTDKVLSSNEPSKQDTLSYYMCQYCCLTFSDTDSFNEHLKTHASDVSLIFYIPIKYKQFRHRHHKPSNVINVKFAVIILICWKNINDYTQSSAISVEKYDQYFRVVILKVTVII